MCPQGKNVGLNVVSIDPLDWIMDDTCANKHGSKKGNRDPICKDMNKQAKGVCMYAKDVTNHMIIVHDGVKQAKEVTKREAKHIITLKDKS